MRSFLLGCLLLAAATSLCLAGEYGVWLQDEVFMVDCCVTKTIPLDTTKLTTKTAYDNYLSPCNPEFCKAVTSDQEKIMQKIIDDNKKKTHTQRVADFHKAHIRERLEEQKSTKVTVFMEDQGLIHNLRSKTRSQTENPGSNFWPKGIVSFKYGADLSKAEASMDAAEKHVLATYKLAIAGWEEGTCINFEASGGATLVFDIDKVNTQPACTGTGTRSVSVIIPSAATLDTTEHELGHVLGLKHTNQRSDMSTYLDWDRDRCYTSFGANDCDPSQINGFDIEVADQSCDTTADLPGPLKTKLGIVGAYDKGNADHRGKCRRHFCAEDWITNYVPNTLDLAGSGYEYASIMHYVLYPADPVECIKMKATKVDDRLGNGEPPGVAISTNDRAVINRHYKCRKLSITNPIDNQAKTVWVHPKMTMAEVASRITSRSGIALALGKKFELTVGTNKHELTGDTTFDTYAADATFDKVYNIAVV